MEMEIPPTFSATFFVLRKKTDCWKVCFGRQNIQNSSWRKYFLHLKAQQNRFYISMSPGAATEAPRLDATWCISHEPPSPAIFPAASKDPSKPSNSSSTNTDGSSDSEVSATCIIGSATKSKSAKRRAAEACLERKASKQRLDSLDLSHAALNSRIITVQACESSSACVTESAHPGDDSSVRWCGMPVTIMPTLDWPTILRCLTSQRNIDDGILPQLPEDIDIFLVETQADLVPALAALRKSMTDSVVAIDLEWRPDFQCNSNNRVALIQLATTTTCVLVRCSRLRWSLPAALRHFFCDPALVFVAFSWDSCDESKMQSTFGAGKDQLFSRFLDLQTVAQSLGYHGCGLARLTESVLGVRMPKSRSVSRSDWQRSKLTPAQVQYAALDALITGHVFRGLRLWHASPSPCTACKALLGVTVRISIFIVQDI